MSAKNLAHAFAFTLCLAAVLPLGPGACAGRPDGDVAPSADGDLAEAQGVPPGREGFKYPGAAARAPADVEPGVDSSGREPMAEINAKVIEELYIAQGNALWAVDSQTAAHYALNPDQPYMNVMASTGGYIYGVLSDHFYRINPDPNSGPGGYVSLGSGWQGSEAMAALSNFVYTVQGGELWKTNGLTGDTVHFGASWAGTEALTAGLVSFVSVSVPYVFGVQGGSLWAVNANNGAVVSLGSGWEGTEAMTFGNGYLFIAQGDALWRYRVASGVTTMIEGYGWSGTEAMTFRDGFIYAVQGGQLWVTSPNGGSVSLGGGWEGTLSMAARR
ncbi:MAG TPA: hypothetical protein VFS43_45740 [Polyangiaceae bacterium]|nr:hypothetical protein [Polyangiaceae bacterium]